MEDKRGSIMLDPGHGGMDSGTVGVNGRLEKNWALEMSFYLKCALSRRGFRVEMTRYEDQTVAHVARVRKAGKEGVQFFLSVHGNGEHPGAQGTETFYFPGSQIGEEMARAVQAQMVQTLGLRDRGVKEGRFFVLRKTAMPAVLIEPGFLTNPGDAEVLFDREKLVQLAEGIAVVLMRKWDILLARC